MIEVMTARTTGMSLADVENKLAAASRLSAKRGIALSNEILEEAFELSRFGARKDWGTVYMERCWRKTN